MNELAVSTSNILNAIEPALTKLSETFCVSVDYLKENAMQYIMMYGRYELANEIMKSIMFSALVGCLIGILTLLFAYDDYRGEWKISLKTRILSFIIPTIILIIIFLSNDIVPYIVSPEMYSLKAVMKLLTMQ